VTGVQTCALPISGSSSTFPGSVPLARFVVRAHTTTVEMRDRLNTSSCTTTWGWEYAGAGPRESSGAIQKMSPRSMRRSPMVADRASALVPAQSEREESRGAGHPECRTVDGDVRVGASVMGTWFTNERTARGPPLVAISQGAEGAFHTEHEPAVD